MLEDSRSAIGDRMFRLEEPESGHCSCGLNFPGTRAYREHIKTGLHNMRMGSGAPMGVEV